SSNTNEEEISALSGVESNDMNQASSKTLDDGVLDLGISADFPPYEYHEDEKIVGIDPEIAEAIGEKLGYEIALHDMDFSAIIASIESGKLDGGISGFTVTEERAQQVNFTDTYANSVQEVLVKKGSVIKQIEDLEGKKIGTQLGSTGDLLAGDDFGSENVQSFAKFPDAVLSLQNGKIDAIIIDQQAAEKFADANDDLEILETKYADEEYAMAITKDNEELFKEVNDVIKDLKESGEIQDIIDKYIKTE
ncbi:transporter substrate-binding domain-containing protein, partial [Anaerococcus sp. AGMB09787]|uniref:transporter substrate-binding domain-containing protein n=1 Tax=Anaerococcus sp. AGMB09787 TaxID=2922869 RepID=UPI001FAF68EB